MSDAQMMTIPREVLLTHLFCAPEDQSVVLSRLHLSLEAAEGRVRASTGNVAVLGSWSDSERGVDQLVELSLTMREAKALAEMAKKEPVVYNHDRGVFVCGSFELSASEPVQRDFSDIGEVPLDVGAGDAKAKPLKGLRVKASSMKRVVGFMTKAKLDRADDLPLVFYGVDAPARIEAEKADMAFTFLLAQHKSE